LKWTSHLLFLYTGLKIKAKRTVQGALLYLFPQGRNAAIRHSFPVLACCLSRRTRQFEWKSGICACIYSCVCSLNLSQGPTVLMTLLNITFYQNRNGMHRSNWILKFVISFESCLPMEVVSTLFFGVVTPCGLEVDINVSEKHTVPSPFSGT
jgi:hypothetical protein